MMLVPRLMKPAVAAKYCGIKQSALEKHGPRPIRLGRVKYYSLAVIDQWLADLEQVKYETAEKIALKALKK